MIQCLRHPHIFTIQANILLYIVKLHFYVQDSLFYEFWLIVRIFAFIQLA